MAKLYLKYEAAVAGLSPRSPRSSTIATPSTSSPPRRKGTTVKINSELIAGQHELSDGDMVEVAGVKMTFGYND
jgi:hypothetical protein